MSFFEINGLMQSGQEFRFPAVPILHLPDDLPEEVVDYIGELETALGVCETVIERLNTDRIEAHRRLRMRDYVEGMIKPHGRSQ